MRLAITAVLRDRVRLVLTCGILLALPSVAAAQSSVSLTATPSGVAPGATVTLHATLGAAWNQDCGSGCAIIGVQSYLQIAGSNGYFTSTSGPDSNGLDLPGSDAGPGQALQPVTYTASGGYHYDLCYYEPGYEFYGCVYGYGSYDESGGADASVSPAVVPTALGVSPSSGTGVRQTFTFQYSSGAGEGDIGQTWQIFHPSGAGSQSCVVGWYRTGGAGTFVLWGDQGWQDQQSAAANSAGMLENSQCRLHMPITTVSGVGNTLTVVLDVSFKSSYTGTKAITMYGWSAGGGYGAPSVAGSWTVSPQDLTSGSVSPSGGHGMTQVFQASFTSNFGRTDVQQGILLVAPVLTNAQACMVAVVPGTPAVVKLWGDDAQLPPASGTIGDATPLENSQCIVDPAATHLSATGDNTWTADIAIAFKANYLGDKQVYTSLHAGPGWTWSGWAVPSTAWTVGPRVTSVTPAAGAYATEAMEVLGEGFGTTADTRSVTINGAQASATTVSDTHLHVTVPTGATSGDLVVTRAGVDSNSYAVTILQGPVITSMTPTWGPEGTTVSISGTSFGSNLGVIRTHAGEPAFHVEVTDWTATQITATVPPGVTSGLLTVTDASGHASRGRPFTVDTEEVVYYHSDAIGSVRMVTGVEGATIERHDFQPFGEEISSSPMRIGFAGTEKDQESSSNSSLGLNYIGARSYAPSFGRFGAADPVRVTQLRIVNPQRWNRYQYAVNNPLAFVDPDGLDVLFVNYTDGAKGLGHVGILALNRDGSGLYGGFNPVHEGRFSDAGAVHSLSLPIGTIKFDARGRPTTTSLAHLREQLAKLDGHKASAIRIKHIKANATETAALKRYIESNIKKPQNYNGVQNNCLDFCVRGMRAAGIPAPEPEKASFGAGIDPNIYYRSFLLEMAIREYEQDLKPEVSTSFCIPALKNCEN